MSELAIFGGPKPVVNLILNGRCGISEISMP